MSLSAEEYVVEDLLLKLRYGEPVSTADFDGVIDEVGDGGDVEGWYPRIDPMIGKLVTEAQTLFRNGLLIDAITRSERAAYPKWPSISACREKYGLRMTKDEAGLPS